MPISLLPFMPKFDLPIPKIGSPIIGGISDGLIDFIGKKANKGKIAGDLKVGMERMLNRSQFKGVMDGAERSHAISGDMLRKIDALRNATGKNFIDLVKEIGRKA